AATCLALVALRPPGAMAVTFTQITADTTRESDPAPSPDGKWIAFTSDREGRGGTQVYIMPAEGGEPRQMTHEPDSVRAGTPSWAPDGKSLLFVSTRGKRYNVYSVPFEGGTPRQLTHAPGSHRFASYSADGRQITFYSNRVRPGEIYGFNIYVMDASGEQEEDMARQVTDSNGSPGHPTWSPDGKWIAFVAKEYDSTRQQTMEGNILFTKYQLYKVPARGGKEIRLTRGQFEDTWPSWSPDGKWIAFGRAVGGKRDVWIYEVATGKTFPVTTTGKCIKPTWAYDSKSIYYSTVNERSNEDIWVARDLDLKSSPPKKSRAGPRAARKITTRTPPR
ncbi:MAG TPA: DPP IV N-terminal domain-containing protein, partial [Candidatus Eisenbacteria bacterium]